MASYISVACPSCLDIEKIVKFGRTDAGKQRYLCRQETCEKKTFILDHTNKGFLPEIKKRIIEMTLNGSGIRDIARVLGISKDNVMSEIKKRKHTETGKRKVLIQYKKNP
jgi:transposase-like protein